MRPTTVIIPIGHDQAIRRLPWVTIAIIAVCTLVQLYASLIAPQTDDVRQLAYQLRGATDDQAAIIQAKLLTLFKHLPAVRFGYATGSGVTYKLITSAFVHEGWLHLIGNMLFLFLAGSAVEDRWGGVRFVVFYLVGAAVAALGFDAVYHGTPTLLIGASGAVSAVMGAFLVHFARSQIRLWYWLWRSTGTFFMPAYVALPLWLAEQVLWGQLDDNVGGAGVAYTAHIAGFAFGVVIAFVGSRLFGQSTASDDASDDGVPVAKALPRAPAARSSERDAFEQRFQQCRTAIAARDTLQVRVLGSRTILDLARTGDHPGILALYRSVAEHLDRVPLTDGAFVAAAAAADALGDRESYIAIATAMLREHPGSPQLPKIVWRQAEHYRDSGRVDLAVATLETLARRFPRDPFGVRASEALASRR